MFECGELGMGQVIGVGGPDLRPSNSWVTNFDPCPSLAKSHAPIQIHGRGCGKVVYKCQAFSNCAHMLRY